MPFERGEAVGPEATIPREPRFRFFERLRIDDVVPFLRDRSRANDAGFAQYPQVTRDRRARRVELLGQLTRRQRTVTREQFDDVPSGRIRERGERVHDSYVAD